jgi:hypothetical protein
MNRVTKFAGRPGDFSWGKYDYPVTRTQKEALDGLRYLMSGLPQSREGIPEGYFCSQRPDNGDVVMGLHHQSVTVDRNGRVTSNQTQTEGE